MVQRRNVDRFRIRAGLMLLLLAGSLLMCSMALAETEQPEKAPVDAQAAKWAYLAAALSVGLGCLGAGIAVAYVGAAAVGAVAEKPQLAARTLIFVGLAEGIAIYGLIIAIMVLGKV